MNESKWYFDSVFYQVFPMSFQDSNDDGIGDLAGLISKLNYIKDLGMDAIYINAGFISAFRDGGFDISDYKDIDPRQGDLKTFDRLVKEAHKRNIKVITDLLFTATSDEHPWFKQSSKMERNRYSKWYVWTEEVPPVKTDGTSSRYWMTYNANPKVERYESYFIGWLPHQPNLNYGFPGLSKENGNRYNDPDLRALRDELKSIVRFWLDRGVDGFRCDAVEGMLPVKRGRKGVHENIARFWSEIREVLDSYGDKFYIAEGDYPADDIAKCKFNGCFFIPQTIKLLSIHSNDYAEKHKEVSCGKRFFSPEGGDITWFVKEYFREYNEAVKHGGMINMFSGNHDLPRFSLICKKDEIIKTYLAMLLTYPTAPFIYYGDEIGMRYWKNLPSKEGAGPRAGSRTPMQWNNKKNAGFSSADSSKLYFPINENYLTKNVKKQENSPDSILNTVKRLINLRRANPSLRAFANIRHLHLKKGDKTYIYSRYGKGDAFVIALNPSDSSRNLTIKLSEKQEEFKNAKYLAPEVYSQKTRNLPIKKELPFHLSANSFVVYRVV